MKPEILNIDLLQLASGDFVSIKVYKFIGSKSGKKAYIQANLHGCEIVGNAVIHQLIEFFSPLNSNEIQGEIWLVPVCNPLATNQRGHFFATGGFDPYDGKDWNRIFWQHEPHDDYLESFAQSQINFDVETIQENYFQEIKKAFENQVLNKLKNQSGGTCSEHLRAKLQSLCMDANYVIDIHSSSNQGLNFLYYFINRDHQAQLFPFEYGIVLGENGINCFDEAFIVPWLLLEKKFNQLGKKVRFDKESYTLELGTGMQMKPDSVQKGVEGIKNYLAWHQILKIDSFSLLKPDDSTMKLLPQKNITRYHAPVGGMIQNRLKLGNPVETGAKIYEILSFNKREEMPTIINVYSEVDGIIFDVATLEAASQGEYVLSVLKTS